MKKNINLFLILILLLGCFAGKNDPNAKVKKLYVVSYNVENLFDYTDDPANTGDDDFLPTSEKKWDSEKYTKKLANLSSVICAIDSVNLPVFVGLYELENQKVIEDLIQTEKLKRGNYGIVHEESPDKRGIDVGFIYQKDVFQYISHKVVPLIIESDSNFESRDILYVEGLLGKDTLHVIVNHWPSRRGGQEESEPKRIAAAQILRSTVDLILTKNPNANIIIMGDMNDEPQNKSLSETLNAKNNNPPTSNTELFNLMYSYDLNNQGSYSYKGEWDMIDNIIISKNLITKKSGWKYQQSSAKIFDDKRFMFYNSKIDQYTPSKTYGGDTYFGGYSDHLPIYMILEK